MSVGVEGSQAEVDKRAVLVGNRDPERLEELLNRFKIRNTIDQLEEKDFLFQTTQKFAAIDLHPYAVPNHGRVYKAILQAYRAQHT